MPHHVTGFWRPVYTGDPATTGSVGAGLLLGQACVRPAEGGAYYNGARVGPGSVSVESPYPLGVGYAGSAVLNIASALVRLGPSLEAYVEAHVAEVRAMTGLGDVLAIYTGGCLVVRTAPGAPGIGEAYGMPCPRAWAVTAAAGRGSTAEMLRGRAAALEAEGAEAVRRFLREPAFEAFLEVAGEFSRRLGFLTAEAERAAGRVRGLLGLYAKKGVVVAVVEPDWVQDAVEGLAALGPVRAVPLVERRVEGRPCP